MSDVLARLGGGLKLGNVVEGAQQQFDRQRRNRLLDLQEAQGQAEMDAAAAAAERMAQGRAMLPEAIGNPDKLAALAGISPEMAKTALELRSSQGKERRAQGTFDREGETHTRDLKKADLDINQTEVKLAADLFAGVDPNDPEQVEAALARGGDLFDEDDKALFRSNPAFVEQLKAAGLGVEGVNKNEQAGLDRTLKTDLQNDQQAFTAGQNAANRASMERRASQPKPGETERLAARLATMADDDPQKAVLKARLDKLTAQSGQTIEVGPDGSVRIAEGPGVQNLTRSTQNQTQKDVIEADERLAGLDNIVDSVDDQFLTLVGKGEAWIARQLDKIGEAGPEQQELLRRLASFQTDTFTNLNRTIQDLTGAAVGVQEEVRLRNQIPDPDKDGPTVFRAKLQKAIDLTKQIVRDRLARSRGNLTPALDRAEDRNTPGALAPDIEDLVSKYADG